MDAMKKSSPADDSKGHECVQELAVLRARLARLQRLRSGLAAASRKRSKAAARWNHLAKLGGASSLAKHLH